MRKKISPLIKKLTYFGRTHDIAENSALQEADREAEGYYRERWQHDKVIRTTHGVNCTGSCSWKVHVKDGIITWETQQTDYPTTGPDMPEYEPRGCQRGATFSWYIYSPIRVKYPYIRGELLRLWQEARKKHSDPVQAWKSIAEDPVKRKSYKTARGKGGYVRATWDEIYELISAQMIHTIQEYGPDRIVGFSPIPAMSMVSYASGARFINLIGGNLLSFYDWYADLPPSSPQVWGEQTDVPETSDWFNSTYLLIWGSNVPQTRTPDAHFMVESRYKGTKVVCISPDYAEFVKFADNWLPVQAGMDGALAMGMTHVILKEFYVDNQTKFFEDYVKQFTDLPYLITLSKEGDHYVAGRFLRASDIGMQTEYGDWKTIVWDQKSGKLAIPNGSMGHRWEGKGKWNLEMRDSENQVDDLDPMLTFLGNEDETGILHLPFYGLEQKEVLKRGIPIKKIDQNGQTIYVTTVFDILMAQAGVKRGNLPGDYPENYDDPKPHTPAWQEKISGIDRKLCAQIAREFAQNAVDSGGRSMIIMGAGINHWYNSDTIYRAILNLVMLCGCEGVNGGGWAHYVGQEKVRPLEGWQTIAMARDWGGPPRLQNGTSFFYFVTEQWRYDDQRPEEHLSPLYDKPRYKTMADYNALAVRLGWVASYPQFNTNSLKIYEQANASNPEEVAKYVADQVKQGNLKFSIEEPSNPINFPRTMFVWRANLIGSSSKGHEYFLKYMLGTHSAVLAEPYKELGTTEVDEKMDPPEEGKLDLMIDIDFRMTSTGLYSDIILPAATWYEKYDISSTDTHPYIHPFNPAITPPWEARSDWDNFKKLAKTFTEMAKKYFPNPVKDVVTTPLLHDTVDEISQKFGLVPDWKQDGSEPIPGQNFPRVHVVERDYTRIFDKYVALGTNTKIGAKGLAWDVKDEYNELKDILGTSTESLEYRDCPDLSHDKNVAEAILTLSSTTNGSVNQKAWVDLEKKTNQKLKHLSEERAEEHISFDEISAQPRKVITSPVFSGIETGNRRYAPFVINREYLVPFRTLTGRQHFYLDHEMMFEYGEELPVFKGPIKRLAFYDKDWKPESAKQEIRLRYLTPHFKWSYHSTYFDTLPMLTLFRGGPHIWLNLEDAKSVGINDNDWLEIYNRNGIVVARAVVSHRIPRGVTYMYHVQERTINVPGSTITKQRGGTFNSPTCLTMKPTHLIGGYAQLSYGFNYYGPTGNQRDEQVMVRRLDRSEVDWLEN
ncbi:nitrate reductase subunit alpha [Neobacillus sp.]|jgi:nitrate reductase / nitrite oxidoreductase, alpha subunit|uniref:nitrate reductase subunit alpha n=1 Tax=Neobacillus sp. TaxID=2675273 RepID=UPI0004F686FC|nr:nitrate reductase [Bacillus sp. X1(2014)]